jgi:hypothetical protein
MAQPKRAPGDTFKRAYAAFAEMAGVAVVFPDIEATAGFIADRLLTLGCDAELVEACRDRYVRTGGER